MNCEIVSVVLLSLCGTLAVEAQEIKIVNIAFPGPAKPKTEVDRARNWYTNHFSVSASYKSEIELDSDIPPNTAFNVGAYAIIAGRRISLGDARVGRAHNSGHVFVSFHIFPSSANYYGQCQFVVVADADNELPAKVKGRDEWKFQATIHPPGESF